MRESLRLEGFSVRKEDFGAVVEVLGLNWRSLGVEEEV